LRIFHDLGYVLNRGYDTAVLIENLHPLFPRFAGKNAVKYETSFSVGFRNARQRC
jgi:hypothetical protein